MSCEFWCPACEDTGTVMGEVYFGDRSEYAGQTDCAQCPTCGCGTRMCEHEMKIGQHIRQGALIWAPECLCEYLGAMQEEEHRQHEQRRNQLVAGLATAVVLAAISFTLGGR